MDTPAEQQRRLLQNPLKFADEMEARGRAEVKNPATELVGRLRVSGAQRLRDGVKSRERS